MRGLLITLGWVIAYILIGLVAARGLRIFEMHNPKHPGRECDKGDCAPYYVGLWLGPMVLVFLLLYVVCRNVGNLGHWVYTRPTRTQRKQLRKERREKETLIARYPIAGEPVLCDHGEHGCHPRCPRSLPPMGLTR